MYHGQLLGHNIWAISGATDDFSHCIFDYWDWRYMIRVIIIARARAARHINALEYIARCIGFWIFGYSLGAVLLL